MIFISPPILNAVDTVQAVCLLAAQMFPQVLLGSVASETIRGRGVDTK
jgi:hypothetical protein